MSLSARFPSAPANATDSVPSRTGATTGTDLHLEQEAKRAHSPTVEIGICHVSLVARPDAVAGLVRRAASAS
ncbi:hypothetical protein [Streptomyces monashensis]|uniref:Uncharacterized protein n=1 Tax=Streptomyces monashensis TaxID=1678012 RepID=A0A1S2QGG4_9ACTN|nr:hypothetical protein [Streptomyces monashensis]OIK05242.1 hypothetical protein BIV23_13340 [Streptomyces monashensis]